jgi:hypothetical protein
VRYDLPGFSERWTLPEEPVPESAWHDACLELIKALLAAWLERTARTAAVYRNLEFACEPTDPTWVSIPTYAWSNPHRPKAASSKAYSFGEPTIPRRRS